MADIATEAAPASLGDAIDAIPVVDGGANPEPPAPESEAPPPAMDAPETPAPEQPAEEEQPAEAAAAEVPEELDPADPLDPDKISPDGKQYHFRAAKAKQLLAARDFQNQIQSALGPEATVENITAAVERSVGLDQFLSDYDSGDPGRVGSAADWFLSQSANQQSIGAFSDHLMAKVASEHPQVYQQISNKVLGGYTAWLYRQAQQQGNDTLLKLAQNLDYQLSKKFRTPEQLQRDPLSDRAADLDRREQQYSLRVQQDRQQWVKQQTAQAEAAVESARTEEISKAIPPTVTDALKKLPDGQTKIDLISMALQQKVEAAIKATPLWERKYQQLVTRFQQAPTEDSKAALVTMMRQFVGPVVARNAKATIGAITGEILSQNAAAHAKQQQQSAKREPAGSNAAPVQRNAFGQKLADMKRQGLTAREGLEAFFGER